MQSPLQQLFRQLGFLGGKNANHSPTASQPVPMPSRTCSPVFQAQVPSRTSADPSRPKFDSCRVGHIPEDEPARACQQTARPISHLQLIFNTMNGCTNPDHSVFLHHKSQHSSTIVKIENSHLLLALLSKSLCTDSSYQGST